MLQWHSCCGPWAAALKAGGTRALCWQSRSLTAPASAPAQSRPRPRRLAAAAARPGARRSAKRCTSSTCRLRSCRPASRPGGCTRARCASAGGLRAGAAGSAAPVPQPGMVAHAWLGPVPDATTWPHARTALLCQPLSCRFNPFEGWVSSQSVGDDILISGRIDMNRAIDGGHSGQWARGAARQGVRGRTLCRSTGARRRPCCSARSVGHCEPLRCWQLGTCKQCRRQPA